MVWNNIDCRDLIMYNISMMIKILKKSEDRADSFKIDSYLKALDNIPDKEIYNKNDLGTIKIAGPSITNKILWIIDQKMNLPEVDDFLRNHGFEIDEDYDTGNDDHDHDHDYDTGNDDHDDDYDTGNDDNDDEAESSCVQTDSKKTHYLSTICHIESKMYECLDIHHPNVKNIIREFNLLREEYSVL